MHNLRDDEHRDASPEHRGSERSTTARGLPASSRKRAVVLTGLAIAGVYGVGLALVGIEESFEVLGGVSPWYLLGALGMQALVVLLWSKVYRASAEATGSRLALWPGLQVSMPAFTLSHTLPGGGWAGNALAAQRLTAFGMHGPPALAAVALASTISLTAIAALGAIGIVMAFVAGDLPTIAVLIAIPMLDDRRLRLTRVPRHHGDHRRDHLPDPGHLAPGDRGRAAAAAHSVLAGERRGLRPLGGCTNDHGAAGTSS